jgi:hypothetical protein
MECHFISRGVVVDGGGHPFAATQDSVYGGGYFAEARGKPSCHFARCFAP